MDHPRARYEHAHVSLHFFEVPAWRGDIHDKVHSALAWQHADAMDVGPMLPANGPILKALRLPARWASPTPRKRASMPNWRSSMPPWPAA